MRCKLKRGEKLSEGIRRVARKQLGLAAGLLRAETDPRGGSVHEARQWLKKARATLQLAKPALGDEFCRREDGKLRKIAHGLARRRDAEVLVLTLEALRSGRRDVAEDRTWEKLQQIFLKRRDSFSGELRAERRKCRAGLKAARGRVDDWPLKKLRWPHLCRALGRIHREGRKALQKAERTRATDDFHAWRRRVKELWYDLRILEAVLPAAMNRRARGMQELGEHLGNEHDLAMLEEALATCKLGVEEQRMVRGRVRSRRAALQQAALKQGRRLFAKSGGEFVKRLKS
jgi:CHAD domain-containing protein